MCAPLSKLEEELHIYLIRFQTFASAILLATVCSSLVKTSMSWVILTVLLVFSSCSWPASGQTSCSLSGSKFIACVSSLTGAYLLCIISHAAAQFGLSTVTVSTVSLKGSTPTARVTWTTTIPTECVTSVTVEFRTDRLGSVVADYTTTRLRLFD